MQFDPLKTVNIAATIARELLRQPNHSLAGSGEREAPPGGGVYAIFYQGQCRLYRPLRFVNTDYLRIPIYVGKAAASATVKGLQGFRGESDKNGIRDRLGNHRRKVENTAASHHFPLRVEDFRFKALSIPDAYIGMAEAGLITFFKPVWNGAGFGNNSPGQGRPGHRPPNWWVCAHAPNGRGLAKNEVSQTRQEVMSGVRRFREFEGDNELMRAMRMLREQVDW